MTAASDRPRVDLMGTAPLRIGVVGCGRVAQQRHLPILHGLAEADLTAICDVDDGTRARLGQKFDVSHALADYHQLVAIDDLDAVLVSAPTKLHAPVALAALEAGKHVLIEKPLALSLDEVDALEQAAARSGRTVAVAMNSRWHRLSRAARDIVRSGRLGKLGLVRSAFTDDFRLNEQPRPWMLQHAQAGCVLVEQAVHHFDLWRFLLDSEVVDIFAQMAEPETTHERAVVTATMANGVLVSAVFTEGLKAINELEIFGGDARLHLRLYDFDGIDVSPRTEYPGTLGPRVRRFKESLRAFPAAFRRRKTGGDWVGSYRTEWQHFIAAVRTGQPVECDLDAGRRALTIGLAAMASLDRAAPVRIADAPRGILPYAG